MTPTSIFIELSLQSYPLADQMVSRLRGFFYGERPARRVGCAGIGDAAASKRRPVTLLARSPRRKHSSDRAMTESALRCCLHISSVSCGSAACDCAGRAALNSSSRWQRSLRTSAGWPSSWHGRLRSRPHAWRERQVTPSRVGIGRVVPATALTGEWQAKLSSAPTAAFLFGDFCNMG